MNSGNEQTEWLFRFDLLSGTVVVFKDDELLLKWVKPVGISIYSNVVYTLHRPWFRSVWSEVHGREASVSVRRVEDPESPAYGVYRLDILVFSTRQGKSEVENGTVIIEHWGKTTKSVLKLGQSDFTDIFVFATDATAWIHAPNVDTKEPVFLIDVYDEALPPQAKNLVNKIPEEPRTYISPKLQVQHVEG